jgi:hypothetical protein
MSLLVLKVICQVIHYFAIFLGNVYGVKVMILSCFIHSFNNNFLSSLTKIRKIIHLFKK